MNLYTFTVKNSKCCLYCHHSKAHKGIGLVFCPKADELVEVTGFCKLWEKDKSLTVDVREDE